MSLPLYQELLRRRKVTVVDPPDPPPVGVLDHPYFEIGLDRYTSKAQVPSITGKKLFIDDSKISYYQSLRSDNSYSQENAWVNNANAKNFTGRALRYVLGEGDVYGQQAIQDIYSDLQAEINPPGDYGRVKNPFELLFSGCCVLSWCNDLFPVAGISYDDLRLTIEQNLYRHSGDGKTAGDHRFPASAHYDYRGGWSGHQNTMLWLHYFYAFACHDSNPEIWDDLLTTHFKVNGIQDSVGVFADWQFHHQGNSYGVGKLNATVFVEFMAAQAGFSKAFLHPKIYRLADCLYYTLQSNYQFIIDGERNNNREYTNYDGLRAAFGATSMLVNDPAYTELARNTYWNFDSAYVDIAFNGMALLFELHRHAGNLGQLPFAKVFGSDNNLYGLAGRSKHDMSSNLNVGDFQVLFKSGLLETGSHGDSCAGNIQVAFNGKLTGKTGQITNNQFTDHAKFWVRNVPGNNMQVFAQNSGGDEIAKIGGVKRVNSQPYTHVGLEELASNRYASVGWNDDDWDYLYSEIDMLPAYDGRAQKSQRVQFAGKYDPLKDGRHPGFVVCYDRMQSNTGITQAVNWSLYSQGTKSGNRVVAEASRGSGHVGLYFRSNDSFSLNASGKTFTYRGVSLPPDTNSTEEGGYRAEAEFDGAGSNTMITLVLPSTSNTLPLDSDVEYIQADLMEGVQFLDQVILFSKTGSLVESEQFTFSGSGTFTVTMIGMKSQEYEQGVALQGRHILRFTASAGTINVVKKGTVVDPPPPGSYNSGLIYGEPFDLLHATDFSDHARGKIFSKDATESDGLENHHEFLEPVKIITVDDDPEVAGSLSGKATWQRIQKYDSDLNTVLSSGDPKYSPTAQYPANSRFQARSELMLMVPPDTPNVGSLYGNGRAAAGWPGYSRMGIDYVYQFGIKFHPDSDKATRSGYDGQSPPGTDPWDYDWSIVDLKQDGGGYSRDATFRIRISGDMVTFVQNVTSQSGFNGDPGGPKKRILWPHFWNNEWHIITIAVRWGTSSDSYLRVRFDGNIMYEHSGLNVYNDITERAPYFKAGPYSAGFTSLHNLGSNVNQRICMLNHILIGIANPNGQGWTKYA